jgi:DNA invertase Pin-like site-specific DNA recombinase
MNIYLYARISREEDCNQISESIENQFLIMDNYVAQKSEFAAANIVKRYDEDYSGINLKRPAISEILTAVRMHKVDVIIIKDFSRLSRDHLDLCTLVDKIFPFADVRIISVLDNYDSNEKQGEPLELSVAFKAILNEFHVIETSEKIKRVWERKMQKGEFISGALPLGYVWKSKGVPVIDEKKADIIREIFALRLEGKTITNISKILNDEQIPVPSPTRNTSGLWGKCTIE